MNLTVQIEYVGVRNTSITVWNGDLFLPLYGMDFECRSEGDIFAAGLAQTLLNEQIAKSCDFRIFHHKN